MSDTDPRQASWLESRSAGPRGLAVQRRLRLQAVLTIYLAVVTVAPAATTPMRSDDIINQHQPQLYADSGMSLVAYLADTIGAWIRDQGRFFPGSTVWTFVVFNVFESRGTYKLFIAALLLTMITLTSVVISRLLSTATGPIVVSALAATLTLRNWFDGLDTFSGVLPLTVCGTMMVLLLLTRRQPQWWSDLVAAAVWAYILTTYEVVILLTPVLMLLVWLRRPRLPSMLPLLLPTVIFMITVLALRSRVTSFKGNAYRINLEPERVLPTYVKQALGGLPWSERWYPGGLGLSVPPWVSVLTLVAVGVPTFVLLFAFSRTRFAISGRLFGPVVLLGLSMWLLPPLLVAISLGWQNELSRGEAYVSVVWGYVGLAILLAAGWLLLHRETSAKMRWRKVASNTANGVIAILAAGSVAQSVAVSMIFAAGTGRY
jgi:hypothetical protein